MSSGGRHVYEPINATELHPYRNFTNSTPPLPPRRQYTDIPLSSHEQQYASPQQYSPPLRPATYTPISPQSHKSYATSSPPQYLGIPDPRRRGLQTRYPTMEPPGRKKLGHNYRPLKQLRKLAQRLLARWLLNVILCGLIVVLFKYYENDGILSQFNKRIFNGLYLGISLFMGMNMVVSTSFAGRGPDADILKNSLKSMADMMKWSILAGGKWTAKEVCGGSGKHHIS